MSAHQYWLALILVTLGTLVYRLVFLGGKRSPTLPDFLKKAMDYVPTAVLAALVIPQFIRLPHPDWTVLGAGIAASFSAWFLKIDVLALVVGFLAYGILVALLG